MSDLVFKRPCGRCPTVAEVPVTLDDVKAGKDPGKDKSRTLKITIGGVSLVDHVYLCDPCLEICVRYVDNIGRELEKRSSTRDHSKKKE